MPGRPIEPVPIQPIYRRPSRRRADGTPRDLTVVARWRENERLPMLRMSGQWLRRIGFEQGDRVRVEVERRRVVITLAGEE